MDNFDVNLDQNKRKKFTFGKVCQKFTKGETCEECNVSDSMYKKSRNAESPVEKEGYLTKAKSLYARSKIFINAINVRDEDKTYPVHVYVFPPSVYDDLMGQIRGLKQLNPESNVFHPIVGNNILISKKNSGILTRYTVQIDNKPSEIPNKDVLDQLKAGNFECLPNLSQVEEFLKQNYLHITTLDSEITILRLLPPYDGISIYKELKFHRFGVASVMNGENENVKDQADCSNVVSGFPGLENFDPFKGQEDAGKGVDSKESVPEFGSTTTTEQSEMDAVLAKVREIDPNVS